jgi:hypothetical protein
VQKRRGRREKKRKKYLVLDSKDNAKDEANGTHDDVCVAQEGIAPFWNY